MIRIHDPRQLTLFADLESTDPAVTFYRRLRKSGCSLSYNFADEQIYIFKTRGIPTWAVDDVGRFRDRIRDDLLRVEHGIEPIPEPETLAGGAVLHRLPTRHPLEHELPVRSPALGAPRRSNPDGAA
jgi:hypothetical protein